MQARSGLTLIELLVVLVILIAIGGVVTVLLSDGVRVRGADGEQRDAEEVVTMQTMRTVRDALIGTSADDPGYRGDMGELPSRLGMLIKNIDGEDAFDPATKRGWRGPYVLHEGVVYGDFIQGGDGFPDNTDIADIEDDPAILDGWGKPVLLQEPDVPDYARIVSAGPNRILETDFGDPSSDMDRGDDLVLFLLSDDPNL